MSVIFLRSDVTVCIFIFSNRLAIEKIAGRGERRIAQRVNLDSEPKMEIHLHQKVDERWMEMAGSFEKASPGTAPPRVPRSPPDWPLAEEVYPLLRTRWDPHTNSAALSGRALGRF